VLTHRFWSTALASDPSVLGKTVRLGERSATIVGVLEPSVPYPAETEIIANVVTSPHHLSATMVTGRVHRMTELFARLAPGASLEAARAELRAIHANVVKQYPEAYPPKADFQIEAVRLRDQLDLDSMDFLDIVMELRKRYGVEVPEADYPQLATLDSCEAYLAPLLADK